MEVTFYISELFYKHDCVIVPGFGGFVGHYAPAKIHPITHSFYPPSKNILFNSKLTRDDGLLLDFISQKEDITYKEAKLKVEGYVSEINTQLAQNKKVILKEVGNLSLDREGNILFEPDPGTNYLAESFGLPVFISPPIVRRRTPKRRDTIFADRKPDAERVRNRKKIIIPSLAAISVIVLLGWLVFNQTFFNGTTTQKTGIVTLPESVNEDITNNHLKTVEDNLTPALKDLDFSDKVEESKIEDPVVDEIKDIIQAGPVYHIIGGAFADPNNAEKFVAILREKGYEAQRAGLSKSGLNMVEYFASEDKDEALFNLEMIRKNDNPAAWLLKK